MTMQTNISNELTRFHELLASNPHAKRFGEKWMSDKLFRDAFKRDPYNTLAQYQIKLKQREVDLVIQGKPSSILEHLEQIRLQKERLTYQFYGQDCAPNDEVWLAWRQRQISRQVFDLGPQHALSNIHSSLAIELNKGCSVGCWFCALSPDKNSIPMLYESGGDARFAALIHAMRDQLGPAVKSGFLYWGTEPMDNPDYERYCLDFFSITGIFPPTTTAIPHKDPDRTRRFLKLAEKHNAWITRFSVASVSIMNLVHSLFTPEELAIAECLPLNVDSSMAYGVAGRYRDYLKKHPEMLQAQQKKLETAPFYKELKDHLNEETHAHGSIACVTGFLVNIVDQSIALIAPTHADEEHPLGYITFAKETFSSNREIFNAINKVLTNGRILHLRDNDMCAFPTYIIAIQEGSDIVFQGRLGTRVRASGLGDAGDLNKLVSLLDQGNYSTQELISSFTGKEDWSKSTINRLWLMGVLKEPKAC